MSAVWTGEEVIMVGAGVSYGFAYRTATDTWRMIGVPMSRHSPFMVWTGREVIVWGGYTFDPDYDPVYPNTGSRYDPALDRWTDMPVSGSPALGGSGTTLWDGEGMILRTHDGHFYRYVPASGWSRISTVNEPGGFTQTMVWTGEHVIVWGWYGARDRGARYDPRSDSWTPLSQPMQGGSRHSHTAAWTGNLMILWGDEAP